MRHIIKLIYKDPFVEEVFSKYSNTKKCNGAPEILLYWLGRYYWIQLEDVKVAIEESGIVDYTYEVQSARGYLEPELLLGLKLIQDFRKLLDGNTVECPFNNFLIEIKDGHLKVSMNNETLLLARESSYDMVFEISYLSDIIKERLEPFDAKDILLVDKSELIAILAWLNSLMRKVKSASNY